MSNKRLALPVKKNVLTLSNILYDQKIFWRIKGLTIKDDTERQIKVEASTEEKANLNVTFL